MSDFISKSRLKWEVEKWYEKEYYSSFNAAVYKKLIKIIDKFPSVEPEKRTEERAETHACDCISRQAAIDINRSHHGQMPNHINFQIFKEIEALPSVEPERPRGKWIYTENHCWICSECGTNPLKGTGFTPTLDGMRIQWKFCNMCGADMRGEQMLKCADNDTAFGGLQSAT